MADNGNLLTSSSMSLPPPPSAYATAPGQQQYDGNNTAGQGNPAHMPPPPLAPVVIPQNTNPIPTAMTSPGAATSAGMLSPGSSSNSSVRRAAPEPNKRALYVGGLDPRVSEDVLRQIFETTGHVQNVKIIPDKNLGAVSEPVSWRNFPSCSRSMQGIHRILLAHAVVLRAAALGKGTMADAHNNLVVLRVCPSFVAVADVCSTTEQRIELRVCRVRRPCGR